LYRRGSELWVADYPGLEARPFLKGPAIRNGQFSPDGRWVAYASNENGRWEIYVTSFPDARGKWQISNSWGSQPRWRGDGKELFYLSSDGQLMAVPISPGTNFDPGAPGLLFRANSRELVATSEQWTYDVTKDGQHFLIDTKAKNAEVQPMTVILNWPSELKEP
jgi:eukaryotic-like serine/threonine-protein kinase